MIPKPNPESGIQNPGAETSPRRPPKGGQGNPGMLFSLPSGEGGEGDGTAWIPDSGFWIREV